MPSFNEFDMTEYYLSYLSIPSTSLTRVALYLHLYFRFLRPTTTTTTTSISLIHGPIYYVGLMRGKGGGGGGR